MDTTVVIPALYMLTGRNASGTDASVWYLLDWGQITRSVKSLQVRTAKAVKQKQWRKLSSLQWMLTHSLAAKLLAVKRVTENAGKRTPGTDGQLWRKGPEKLQGALTLKLKGYEPKPVRRIYILYISDQTLPPVSVETLPPVSVETLPPISVETLPLLLSMHVKVKKPVLLCRKNDRATWQIQPRTCNRFVTFYNYGPKESVYGRFGMRRV